MFAHLDLTRTVDEPRSERMNFRLKPHVKETIVRAAEMAGVDASTFAMSAAYDSALRTIAAHERTILQPVDQQAFFDALDNPPQPTEALRRAFTRHRDTVTRK